MTGAPPDEPRDGQGRFAKGHPGGPGRPPGSRRIELAQAAQDAVEPKHMRALMGRMLQRGIRDGDVSAARFVAERALGRPTCVPAGEPLLEDQGTIETLADLVRLMRDLLKQVADGRLPPDALEKLGPMFEQLRRLHETQELEERMRKIEKVVMDGEHREGV